MKTPKQVPNTCSLGNFELSIFTDGTHLVDSSGKTACYISDLIPMLSHPKPTWVMGYDLFPLETIDNRKKFYAEAVHENWRVVFTHEPHTPMVFLDEDDKGKVIARPVGEAAPLSSKS
jgi:hypothetical protein